jgi:hypothetical protein
MGHIAKVLDAQGILSRATDLYDYGYGEAGIDFLNYSGEWHGDIVTNPPYSLTTEFMLKCLSICDSKVGLFLPTRYLASVARGRIYRACPPKIAYIYSARSVSCWKNGEPLDVSSAVDYMWLVWEKGTTGTKICWL